MTGDEVLLRAARTFAWVIPVLWGVNFAGAAGTGSDPDVAVEAETPVMAAWQAMDALGAAANPGVMAVLLVGAFFAALRPTRRLLELYGAIGLGAGILGFVGVVGAISSNDGLTWWHWWAERAADHFIGGVLGVLLFVSWARWERARKREVAQASQASQASEASEALPSSPDENK